MAHDIEINVQNYSNVPCTAYKMAKYTGCAGSLTHTRDYANSYAGVRVHYGRDASHHTEMVKGWREPTPYWGYRFYERAWGESPTYEPVVMSTNTSRWGNTYRVQVGLTPTENLVGFRPFFPALQAEAITACLAEVGSATAELGVELREARKTAGFLADTIRGLYRSAMDLRRGRVPAAWRELWRPRRGTRDYGRTKVNSFANKWMEYRYAWSPTVLGIYDILDLLDDQTKGKPLYMTARKRVEQVHTDSENSFSTSFGPYLPMQMVMTDRTRRVDAVYVVATWTVSSRFLATLNEAGIVNPASVLYETIPFSWMADWFVNVGDYINARFANQFLDLKGATATHIWEHTVKRSVVHDPAWAGTVCTPTDAGPATAGGTSFNRVRLWHDDMVGSLQFERDPLNLTRVTDALSLLAGVFLGNERSPARRSLRV